MCACSARSMLPSSASRLVVDRSCDRLREIVVQVLQPRADQRGERRHFGPQAREISARRSADESRFMYAPGGRTRNDPAISATMSMAGPPIASSTIVAATRRERRRP